MTPFCTALLLVGLTSCAADPKPAPRADAHGDPLPADAIARFGTVHWRHGHHITALAFRPDGKQLVSTADDGTLRTWDVADGRERLRLASPFVGQSGATVSFTLSPDGKMLAMPTATKLHFFDLVAGKELPAWDSDGADQYLQACFAPDGKALALSGPEGVSLWDVAGHKIIRRFPTLRFVTAPTFSTDGRLLAAGDGQVIRVWDVATGKAVQRLARHRDRVHSIAFSPDATLLASAGDDNAVRVWDIATGKELRQMGHPDTRPATTHFVMDTTANLAGTVAFLPDGKALVSCVKGDQSIRLWDVATGKELRQFVGHRDGSLCIALSADGKTLAAAGEDSVIRLWDVASGKERFPNVGHQARVYYAAASADGKTVISAGRDNTVRVWDAATGKELRRIGGDTVEPMGSVAVSPDGKVLAAWRSDDEVIHLWDLTTGKPLRDIECPKSGVAALAFRPDGKVLASIAVDDEDVYQWDVMTGAKLREWKAEDDIGGPGRVITGMKTLAWSPDGSMLLTLAGVQAVFFWEAGTGKLARKITWEVERRSFPYRVVMAPDGRTVAVLSRDNTVSIYAADTGQKRHRLTDLGLMHPQGMLNVESVAYSPDGRLLGTVGPNGKVQVWEVATGTLVREMDTDLGWVSALCFAPDSRTLIAGGLNTTVLALDLTGYRSGLLAPVKGADPKELEASWTALRSDKGVTAYEAMWALATTPAETLPFLQKELKGVAAPDPQRLDRLMLDLDSNVFAVRQKATDEVEKLGEQAEDALRKALAGKPSVDLKQRVEALLQKCSNPPLTGDRLRALRALSVLEQIGTPEARQQLEELARGVSSARVTIEARAALRRLER